MKNLKKSVSIILALLMALSALFAALITAEAKDTSKTSVGVS